MSYSLRPHVSGLALTLSGKTNGTGTRRHVEFIAVHKATGQHILVEAKSRHRAGVMGRTGERDEKPDIRFRKLINDAIAKDPNNPLAIFVDTNLPPKKAELFYEPESRTPLRPSKAMATLMEAIRKEHGGVDPYNLLVFSNHPQHYSDGDEVAPGNRWAGIISQKARVPVHHLRALQDLFYGREHVRKCANPISPSKNSNRFRDNPFDVDLAQRGYAK